MDRNEARQEIKKELEQINFSIQNIYKISEFHGEEVALSAQKIIDQCERIPLNNSVEALGGLSQILVFLSHRMGELEALYQALSDSSYVAPEVLAKILSHPTVGEERYVMIELFPVLPENLRQTLSDGE